MRAERAIGQAAALFVLSGILPNTTRAMDGNVEAQEVGDLLYITLCVPLAGVFLDDHPAIFEGDPPSPDTRRETLIEMEGGGTIFSSFCGSSRSSNVARNTLAGFKSLAPGIHYYGAHDFNAPSLEDRQAFIATARSLIGKLPYVANFKSTFVEFVDENMNGFLDGNDKVTALRSDGFAEFVYTSQNRSLYSMGAVFWATQGEPFGRNLFDATSLYNRTNALGITVYTPRDQRAQLSPSVVMPPDVEMHEFFDGQEGKLIPNGGSTNKDTVTVKVSDQKSGPGCLEIWRGDPGEKRCGEAAVNQGATRVFFDDTDFNTAAHTYTAGPLGTDGQYFVKAFDRAGNETSVHVSIGTPLFLVGEKKLIFFRRARKNQQNLLFAEFYHSRPPQENLVASPVGVSTGIEGFEHWRSS